MPPKKSGKKKKGKKSGKKSATKPSPTTEQLSELSKEFYLIQIRDLENRLTRYQKKCDELEEMNRDFRKEFDQLTVDKKEIVSFLKKSLDQRGDEITDLNDRLIGLQQAKDTEKEQMEAAIQGVRSEYQENKDRLTSENMILHGKLASLEEFKVQKEDLMAKFASMEDKLKKQEEHHQEIIYNLERKQVVDKDRLKKEMVMRVNQVAAEFRKVSNKQMAETTKRTIRENVSINAQLQKMSDKTLDLIEENDEMADKEKKTRQTVDMLEANEKELAKKNHSNQKIIRMLTEKCRNQEAVIDELELREQEYAELEGEADLLRQQVESSREELQKLAKDNELLEDETGLTKGEVSKERRERQKLEHIVTECAHALKVALTTTTTEDVEESPYEAAEKRNNMLENLLVLMNSAAVLGVGPSPGVLGKRVRSASKMPGANQGLRRSEMSVTPPIGMGTAPHYQLGDLGLIPRPAHHIPSHIERVKELTAHTRLGSLKKVLTRSVAVQTVSTPKAMFFADQLLSRIPQQQGQVFHNFEATTITIDKPPHLTASKKVPSKVF